MADNKNKMKYRSSLSFKFCFSLFLILSLFIASEGHNEYENSKKILVSRLQNHFLVFFINPAVNAFQLSSTNHIDFKKLAIEQLSDFKKCETCHSNWPDERNMNFYSRLKESIRITMYTESDELPKVAYTSSGFATGNIQKNKLNNDLEKKRKNLPNPKLNRYIDLTFMIAPPANIKGMESEKTYIFSLAFPEYLVSEYIKNKFIKKFFVKIFFLIVILSGVFIIFNFREKKSLRGIIKIIDKISHQQSIEINEYKFINEHRAIGEKLELLSKESGDRESKIVKQKKGLEYLNVFMGCLSRSSGIKEQIDYLAEYISRLVNFKRGCVWIFNDTGSDITEFYNFDNKGNSFKFDSKTRITVDKTYFHNIVDKNSTIIRKIAPDFTKEYAEDIFFLQEKQCTVCYSPIYNEKGQVGYITLLSDDEKIFTPESIKYIEYLCKNVCISIQNSHLMGSLSQSRKELDSIFRITRILASSLNLKDVFKDLEEEIKRIVDFDIFAITLPYEKNRKKIKILSSNAPIDFYSDKSGIFDRENTSINIAIDTGQPFLRRDTTKEQYFTEDKFCINHGIFSYITYPVWNKGKIAGTLNFYHKTKGYYSDEDLHLLKPISEQIGVAIENSMLFDSIKKSREEWVATFDSVNDHICIIGQNNIIIKANKSLAKFLNTHPRDLVGKKCHEVLYRSKTCINDCPHSKMIKSEKTETSEMFDDINNTSFLISVSPVKDKAGKINGAMHIARDITEEKKLKEQLIQSEKMASIGQLVSGVAHELNNPLAGINAYSQLLLEDNLDEIVKNKIERIKLQSERAAKIVSNLLAFARKKKPEKIITDINDIIRKSIELQQYELEAKKVKVVINLTENLRKIKIDPLQIQQVLLNLLVNAEHAVNEQNIQSRCIEVSSSAITKKGKDCIRICISDNGKGIPKNVINKIFDPFFTTKEVGKGTGLGLSISYGIILEHGGTIYAENIGQKGARFVIDLPASKNEKLPKDNIIEFKVPVKRSKLKSILIVDDEDDLRKCMKEYFSRKKFNVFEAKNGTVALDMIKKIKDYDYIISDIRMPGIGGQELYKRIITESPNLASKIIFITGDTINNNTINFLKTNSCPYLLKPFTFGELENHLQKISA